MKCVYGLGCLLLTALVLAATGCGDESVDGRLAISGSVAFRGNPLKHGTIEITAQDGSQQTGATIVDGAFSIEAKNGLPPGTYVVRISSVEEKPGGPDPEAPGPESAEPGGTELIPAAFNTNSKETIEVKAGEKNHFEIKIP